MRGKWINENGTIKCSVCKKPDSVGASNYCKCCGACLNPSLQTDTDKTLMEIKQTLKDTMVSTEGFEAYGKKQDTICAEYLNKGLEHSIKIIDMYLNKDKEQ